MSPNIDGMYFYCVDSVMSYLVLEKGFGKIYVKGVPGDQIDKFPFEVRGILVQSLACDGSDDCAKQMKNGDILLSLSDIGIIRDQYNLAIKVQQRREKRLERFASYVYFFQFKYLPESRTYMLRRFEKGVRN